MMVPASLLLYLIVGSADFLALRRAHRLFPEGEVVEGELGHRGSHWNGQSDEVSLILDCFH